MEFINNLVNKLTTFKAIHIIITIGIIAFANSLFNPFVWDDNSYILHNSTLKSFNYFDYFGQNVFNNSGQYRPLTVTYFALLYKFFGEFQFFYHLIQVVIHVANTGLLFFLFKSFFNKKIALFLSLVFLVHPMQVESVSYISSAGGALSFLFGIIALIITGRKTITKIQIFSQYLLLLASMLVKEVGVLFIPILLFYRWKIKNKGYKRDILYSIITLAAYLFIRIGIGNILLAERPLIPIARISFLERLTTIPEVIFYYIKTFFFPLSFAIDQHWTITKITIQDFYLPVTLILIFFSILIFLSFAIYKKSVKQFYIYMFFYIWFIVGLSLHSQIFPLDMTVADRWFYFDMAGLLGIFGVLLQNLYTKLNSLWKSSFYILGMIVVILLTLITMSRNLDWSDYNLLYTKSIAISDNFLLQEEYALELFYDEKYNEALIPAKKSVEYFPHEENLYNLGYIYEKLDNIEMAQHYYEKSLNAKNYTPGELHHNLSIYLKLAKILFLYNDPKKSKRFIEDALKIYPNSDRLWLLLSLSEYIMGNSKEALKAAKKAYEISPSNENNKNVYFRLINNQHLDIKF